MKAIEKLSNEHDALLANYDALLKLLHEVAAGKIHRSQLSVDLQARGWAVSPPEFFGPGTDREVTFVPHAANGKSHAGPQPSNDADGLTIEDVQRWADEQGQTDAPPAE